VKKAKKKITKKPPPPEESCGTCEYYETQTLVFDDGSTLDQTGCHYLSPHVGPDGSQAVWPQTSPDDWCGQFKAKP